MDTTTPIPLSTRIKNQRLKNMAKRLPNNITDSRLYQTIYETLVRNSKWLLNGNYIKPHHIDLWTREIIQDLMKKEDPKSESS